MEQRDQESILHDMIELVVNLYFGSGYHHKGMSLRQIADEMEMSVSKVVKLLITGNVYSSELIKEINDLHNQGLSVIDIQNMLGISRATVQSYLPYKKGVYKSSDASANANRIRKYRERVSAVELLISDMSIDSLWNCIEVFQGYGFRTSRGLKFRYTVKGGEIFVDRKESSKSITKSTVEMAFDKAMEIMETDGYVSGPKKLGTFGASYLYPMFIRFGIIEISQNRNKEAN